MAVRLLEGDMLAVLADMPSESIDACVTDPPYGLRFMGKAWDHGVPGVPYWQAVSRVLKPGSHLVAFGGTRTHHRLMVAIEDTGFEIRDCLMWLYGSGFPKGKGCLKPGWEPIVLARKPGPHPWLNVDGCRIEGAPRTTHGDGNHQGTSPAPMDWGKLTAHRTDGAAGRWPANVVFSHESGCREVGQRKVRGNGRPNCNGRDYGQGASVTYGEIGPKPYTARATDADGTETVAAWECVPECAVRLLDEQSGLLTTRAASGLRSRPKFGSTYGAFNGGQEAPRPESTGGASRFFYCAKASPSERGAFNDHPTVKPIALMRWLVRLATPPGGTILDPFMGSGSTVIAADREGFEAIGIDRDPHAVEIARRRLYESGPLFAAPARQAGG